ncbi:MAG: ABC transporter ATP-binding protein [Cytophagales bacterium]
MFEKPLVEVRDLVYEYPKSRALNHVSFSLQEGSITALVGPNGAGKSTLMRCMAALMKPLSGDIFINGIDVVENPRETHRLLGYLSDFFGLYEELNVEQSLHHAAALRGLFDDDATKAIIEVVSKLEIEPLLARKNFELSRGQRQRVGIAQAIIHKPKIVLLDEPASGLDPEARHQLSDLLKSLNAEGISFLVSSHILTELEEYSNELLVIDNGKILDQKSLTTKKHEFSKKMIVQLAGDLNHAKTTLENLNGVLTVEIDHQNLMVSIPQHAGLENQVLLCLINQNLTILNFFEMKLNLQEEYIKTIKQSKS